ncbi:DDB1- and CUL4-associated factor 6 [Gonapodya sp. JEL0774]|nr:DDB1- and CUL4-associated factor 6 [Gonapodya sp. JEL0774]
MLSSSSSDDHLLNIYRPFHPSPLVLSAPSGHTANVFSARFLGDGCGGADEAKVVSCAADGAVSCTRHTLIDINAGAGLNRSKTDKARSILKSRSAPPHSSPSDADADANTNADEPPSRRRPIPFVLRSLFLPRRAVAPLTSVTAISINPVRPWLLVVAGGDGGVRVVDRRKVVVGGWVDVGERDEGKGNGVEYVWRKEGVGGGRSRRGRRGPGTGDGGVAEEEEEDPRLIRASITSAQWTEDGREIVVSYSRGNVCLVRVPEAFGSSQRERELTRAEREHEHEEERKCLSDIGDNNHTDSDGESVNAIIDRLVFSSSPSSTTSSPHRALWNRTAASSRRPSHLVVQREQWRRVYGNENVEVDFEDRDTVGVYGGHKNERTMIKEAIMYGDYVMSGADNGKLFVWHRSSSAPLFTFPADRRVLNCVVPHPTLPVIALSGIDNTIKIAEPMERASGEGEDGRSDSGWQEDGEDEEDDSDDEGDSIAIPPDLFLRMLAALAAGRGQSE